MSQLIAIDGASLAHVTGGAGSSCQEFAQETVKRYGVKGADEGYVTAAATAFCNQLAGQGIYPPAR